MPTYDYVCDGCSHAFTKFCSIADRNLAVESPCPECGEPKIRQSFGAPPMLDPHRMGRIKHSDGFNDLLKNIKKRNPGSVLNY